MVIKDCPVPNLFDRAAFYKHYFLRHFMNLNLYIQSEFNLNISFEYAFKIFIRKI